MAELTKADLSHIEALVLGVLEAADQDIHSQLIGWELVDEAYIVAEMFNIKTTEERNGDSDEG